MHVLSMHSPIHNKDYLIWTGQYDSSTHQLFCVQAVKALASLGQCAGLHKPLLLAFAISSKILCACPYKIYRPPDKSE